MGIFQWLQFVLRYAPPLLDFRSDKEGFREWCGAAVSFSTALGKLLGDPLWLDKIVALVDANVNYDATYDELYELVSLFLRHQVGADEDAKMPWWLSLVIPVVIELLKRLFNLKKEEELAKAA